MIDVSNPTTHMPRRRSVPRPMPSNFVRFTFRRDLLPNAAAFYASEGVNLTGNGRWRNAKCPFHEDTNPSMRVFIDTGAFRCMACGAHGGDVLAFFMLRYGKRFIEAAKAMGVWEVQK
jgi:hypothetical protein